MGGWRAERGRGRGGRGVRLRLLDNVKLSTCRI